MTGMTGMTGAPLDVAGTRLWLRPDGLVWWPDTGTLFAADLHLGKGAAFRAGGLPIPAGSSAAALDLLDAAATDCSARRLVVLGDFWHHASGLGPALDQAVAAFAARWPVVLVPGNHDRQLPAAARAVPGLHQHEGPWVCGGLQAVHEPPPPGDGGGDDAAPFWLAGHLHPAVLLRTRAGDRLRRPCFVQTAQGLVLPALGRLSGHLCRTPQEWAAAGARVAVVLEDGVAWLPGAQPAPPGRKR